MKSISESSFGVYGLIEGKEMFAGSGNNLGVEIKRRIVEEKSDCLVLQLEVVNKSKKEMKLFSAMVSEFSLVGEAVRVLENGWGHSSFAGYRKEIKKTKKKRFFLMRDQNPHSFLKKYGYLEGSMVSEWFSQLVFEDKSVVIGAVTTADQFSQVYLKNERRKVRVRVTCQMDGMSLKPGEKILSEKIAFIEDGETGRTLSDFADTIRRYSKTRSVTRPPVGLCCAYYYQGNVVDEEYLEGQIRGLSIFPKRTDLKFIEIDAGYCVWGDWLEINKSFPGGLNKAVDVIKKLGYKAGIWIAPYVATIKSNLYKDHPDWFLRDEQGREVNGRQSSPFDFLPSLSLKVLDPTKPEVEEYVTSVVRQFVEWGFELIKVDFTSGIAFTTNYSQPMTRAQAVRRGYQIVRKAAEEKTHILSGITQLSSLVGMVDSVRVGVDAINPFVIKYPFISKKVNGYMFKENMRNSSARLFLNGKVWINDTDCFVGRLGTGLTEKQIEAQFNFIKKYKGSVWIGDSLKAMTKTNLDEYTSLLKKK